MREYPSISLLKAEETCGVVQEVGNLVGVNIEARALRLFSQDGTEQDRQDEGPNGASQACPPLTVTGIQPTHFHSRGAHQDDVIFQVNRNTWHACKSNTTPNHPHNKMNKGLALAVWSKKGRRQSSNLGDCTCR